MSREITVTSTMTIRKLDADGSTVLIDRSYSGSWIGDMTGAKGPTPGALEVGVMGSGGTPITFAQLTQPGEAWVEHQGRVDGSASEADDYIMVGIHDPEDAKFWPVLELRPGRRLPLPLSRHLGQSADMTGPGTGTAGQGETARLLAIAYPVPQKINVEAFEF